MATVMAGTRPIADDLAFSAPLVRDLEQSGLRILSVRSSTYAAFFNSSSKAAWIETDQGILEAVFFATSAEADGIRVSQASQAPLERYTYLVQAGPPTLLHDQTIDAAFPLYFTVAHGMFMATSSPQLDQTLKHLFAGR